MSLSSKFFLLCLGSFPLTTNPKTFILNCGEWLNEWAKEPITTKTQSFFYLYPCVCSVNSVYSVVNSFDKPPN